MTTLLTFAGQQLGDGVISHATLDDAATPVAPMPGTFHHEALLANDGPNFVYGLRVAVWVTRTTQWACDAAIRAMRSFIGQRGHLTIHEGITTRVKSVGGDLDRWWLQRMDVPSPADAHGGRFSGRIELTFVGPLPLVST